MFGSDFGEDEHVVARLEEKIICSDVGKGSAVQEPVHS